MKTLILAAAMAAALAAQERPSPASGAAMYRAYCASCHGVQGKGDGPAAPALKQRPADLTTLAKQSGGKFPAVRVFQSVEGDAAIAAHGSREMPVWGTALRRAGADNEAALKLRVRNLVRYIESIQVK
jgi:mono/diheme cytochrome c family protein